jgi:DNA-binding CsgD family transcriptional regulator
MVALTEREYDAILAIVAAAAEGTADEPLPPPVLDAIRRLVPPADTCAFFAGLPWDRSTRRVWVSGAYLPWTEPEWSLLDRFRAQSGIQAPPLHVGLAVRISDFMDQPTYRRTDLYQTVGRRHGIEYSLDYWIRCPAGVARGLTFDSSTRDFGDIDAAVIEVLGRHLARLLARFDPPRADRRAGGARLTDRQREILAWVAQGDTNEVIAHRLSISAHTVRKHLENTFTVLGVHTRAAAIAVAYREMEGRADSNGG